MRYRWYGTSFDCRAAVLCGYSFGEDNEGEGEPCGPVYPNCEQLPATWRGVYLDLWPLAAVLKVLHCQVGEGRAPSDLSNEKVAKAVEAAIKGNSKGAFEFRPSIAAYGKDDADHKL